MGTQTPGDTHFTVAGGPRAPRPLEILTLVVAGGQHAFVCRAGTNVPDLPRLMQEHIFIDNVVLVVKVYDVDLQTQGKSQSEAHTLPTRLHRLETNRRTKRTLDTFTSSVLY